MSAGTRLGGARPGFGTECQPALDLPDEKAVARTGAARPRIGTGWRQESVRRGICQKTMECLWAWAPDCAEGWRTIVSLA